MSFLAVLVDAIEGQDDPSAVLAALVHELARRGTLPTEIRIAGPWISIALWQRPSWVRERLLHQSVTDSRYAARVEREEGGPRWRWEAGGVYGYVDTPEEARAAADAALAATEWVLLG